MTNNQLFFAMVGVFGTFIGLVKFYTDAKLDGLGKLMVAKFEATDKRIDGLAGDVKSLMEHIIKHSERIAVLETRVK